MKHTIFTGMATAMVTPMTPHGVDYDTLARFIEFQIAQGINALVAVGTTGESATLSPEERKAVIAFTVKQRAENAVARFNRQIRRSSMVKTQVIPRSSGDASLIVTLNDELSTRMTLELSAPNQRQAVRLAKLFEKKADMIYNLIMMELLDEEEALED